MDCYTFNILFCIVALLLCQTLAQISLGTFCIHVQCLIKEVVSALPFPILKSQITALNECSDIWAASLLNNDSFLYGFCYAVLFFSRKDFVYTSDEILDKTDLDILGEGGLCLGCDICTFPECGFGKGK